MEKINQPKILVFGVNGQLGRCLQDIANLKESINFSFVESQEVDLTKKNEIETCFQAHRPAYCINAAAYTAVDKAEDEPEKAYAVNEKATAYLAKACKTYNTVFIHISTDFVFDGNLARPLLEYDDTCPINKYGASKLAGEKALMQIWEKHIIIRTSWLFSEYGKNFLKTMSALAQLQKEIKVVNDQIGTPTYAKHLAQTIFTSIEEKYPYGLYHYSNEGVASWYDFAYEVFQFYKTEQFLTAIPVKEYPTPAQLPLFTVLNKEKIKARGLHIPHWREGVRLCLEKLNHGQ